MEQRRNQAFALAGEISGSNCVMAWSRACLIRALSERRPCLEKLNADLAVPSLQAYGIDAARYGSVGQTMAEQALASGSPANNPRVPAAAEIVTLYEQAYSALPEEAGAAATGTTAK